MPAVESGSVVATSAGCLPVKKILHLVAIDAFYDSRRDLVQRTLELALATARDCGAKTIAMPALATGYGHLSMREFARALGLAAQADWTPVEKLVLVLRTIENADIARKVLER
jgi:O-acetyl-ADP-ribose deacetylase (regulator of RNase III)